MSSFVKVMTTQTGNNTLGNRESKGRFRWTTFLIHLVAMSLLFLLPEVIVSLSNNSGHAIPMPVYVKVIIYAGAFYANFYWFVDSMLIRSYRPMRFALSNLVVVIVGVTMLVAAWHMLEPGHKPPMRPDPPEMARIAPEGMGGYRQDPYQEMKGPDHMPVDNIARDVIVLILTIALAVAIKLNFNRFKSEQERREMMALHKEIELKQLRSQLSPHFLFNTLNSIYALVDIDPVKAKKAVHRLSRMLRYMLSESRQPVTVSQEIDFINGYIELMKMRMSPDFPVKARLDCSLNPEAPIAPLIFINVVENAFKYGLTTSSGRGIDIDICLDDGIARCIVVNGYDPDAAASLRKRSSGIGLNNLRRRLELRYPSCHSLEICDNGHEFRVRLEIDVLPSRARDNNQNL